MLKTPLYLDLPGAVNNLHVCTVGTFWIPPLCICVGHNTRIYTGVYAGTVR